MNNQFTIKDIPPEIIGQGGTQPPTPPMEAPQTPETPPEPENPQETKKEPKEEKGDIIKNKGKKTMSKLIGKLEEMENEIKGELETELKSQYDLEVEKLHTETDGYKKELDSKYNTKEAKTELQDKLKEKDKEINLHKKTIAEKEKALKALQNQVKDALNSDE